MLKAAGLNGCWVCPSRADHEFMEDSERTGLEMADRWNAAEVKEARRNAPPPKRCPRCGAPAKQNGKGRWYCDNAEAHSTLYLLPAEDQPYWLAPIGIKEPLPDVPQANVTDGGICLYRGVYEHKGGNKSGRKRKKPKKKSPGNHRYFDF